jgi:hypothetical protein
MSNTQHKTLLSIVELGGYANFVPLYQRLGYSVTSVTTSRKAIAAVKKAPPDVIVAEFNYQSDFRDRTSTLESLLAAVERHRARYADTRVIVLYEEPTRDKLDRLLQQFSVFETLAYPVSEAMMESVLQKVEAP